MDVMQELNKEIAKQVAEAYDKGCLLMLDKVIELAEINRGHISVDQLKGFKEYAEKIVAEANKPKHVIEIKIDTRFGPTVDRYLPTCSCGWGAFMPYFSRDRAVEAGAKHVEGMTNET